MTNAAAGEPISVGIRERFADVNGVRLHVLEAGDPSNPTIILSHGFPEAAYSWRHQLPVLARAGYHVIAPDQRGYGRSSVPTDVDAYGIQSLTGDLVALLDDAGKDDAVFVGHDWGAWIVWEAARLHSERVRAVVGVSVPAVQWPAPPIQLMKMVYQDRFFYILYFQAVGPAETELGIDVRSTVEKVLWGASGEGFVMPTESPAPAEPSSEPSSQPSSTERTGFLTNMPTPPPLPWAWLTEDDVQYYAEHFERSGFFGPVSYYRNLDANYELVKDIGLDRITMPSFYIGGSKDPVLVMDSTGLDRMTKSLPNYYGARVIDGVGHWTQQEKPSEFNDALLGFLRRLDEASTSSG